MKCQLPYPILYEDKNTLIINKPAGLTVHGDGKTSERSLADFLIDSYPELAEIGEPIELPDGRKILRPGIVHRLDKDTSGAILIARTQEAFEFYKNQFKEHQVKKTYHAFVYGWPKRSEDKIITPISRSRGDIRRYTAKNGRGLERMAETDFEVLKRFSTVGHISEDQDEIKGSTLDGDYSFMAFYPKTGRPHQIRVHATYLNHPVVSDPLYAAKRSPALGFKRQALHARELSLLHFQDHLNEQSSGQPSGQSSEQLPGQQLTVLAPYPPDFIDALTKADISEDTTDKPLAELY